MASKKEAARPAEGGSSPAPIQATSQVLREPAEVQFQRELDALAAVDTHERPPGWRLSPRAVLAYICGKEFKGVTPAPKYIGNERLVEIAIATLTTDRALLLLGEPGTAKSWLSEHLAAAISGTSQLLVQGTAGTTEEQIRYTWNYAMLLAEGPSLRALVPSPVYRCMTDGKLLRFEEITRCPSEVQDALITLLSEKTLAVPELGLQVQAQRGFNLIATANTRDRGVNDMSAALKRRFNMVVLPVPSDMATEIAIVERRVAEIGQALRLPAPPPGRQAVERVVQIFQELRRGQTLDGKNKVKSPSGVLSTAEAISVLGNGMALAGHFGDGTVTERDLAAGILGAIVKEDARDEEVFLEYLENILKKRGAEWTGLYRACKELL